MFYICGRWEYIPKTLIYTLTFYKIIVDELIGLILFLHNIPFFCYYNSAAVL